MRLFNTLPVFPIEFYDGLVRLPFVNGYPTRVYLGNVALELEDIPQHVDFFHSTGRCTTPFDECFAAMPPKTVTAKRIDDDCFQQRLIHVHWPDDELVFLLADGASLHYTEHLVQVLVTQARGCRLPNANMEQVHIFECSYLLDHVSLNKGEQPQGMEMIPPTFLNKVECQAVRIRLVSTITESDDTSGVFAREENSRGGIHQTSVFINAHNVSEVRNRPLLLHLGPAVPVGVPYGKESQAIRIDVVEVSVDNTGIFQRHISPTKATTKRHRLDMLQCLRDVEHYSSAIAISAGIYTDELNSPFRNAGPGARHTGTYSSPSNEIVGRTFTR